MSRISIEIDNPFARSRDPFLITGIFPGSNVRVTHAAPNEPRSECSISVDPGNPNRLVGASKRFYDPHAYLFDLGPVFSDDGGATWTDAHPLQRPPNHEIYTDPSTTFDTGGGAWVMGDPGFLTAQHPDLFQSLQCASHGQRSTDDIMTTHMLAYRSMDGANWNQPLPIIGVRCRGDDKGWIACDNTIPDVRPGIPSLVSRYRGRLYAIWGASTPLYFARSSDQGKTWSGVGNTTAGTQVTANFDLSYAPDVSIGRHGTIHVFWSLRNTSSIYYLRSTDGGDSFHGEGMSGAFPKPREVVTGMTTLDHGISSNVDDWRVFPPSNFRVLTIVSACCFGDSGVAVAWADARPDKNGKVHSRIYFRVSHDNGNTWVGDPSGTPMLPPLGESHQFHPQLAATANGVLGCAMYSYSPTAIAFKDPGISVIVPASFDQGTTWDWKQITDSPWDPSINAPWAHGNSNVTFIGEYFGFDAGLDDFHVLWTDTRNNNQDLYYCHVLTQKHRNPQDLIDELVATLISAGVAAGSSGFAVVGGHIIRVPAGDPIREVLDAAVAIEALSRVGRTDTARAKAALYDVISEIMQQAKRDIRG